MTITDRVQGAFFDHEVASNDVRLIRLAPNAPPSKGPTRRQGRPWTHEEHDKFLQAMEIYPSGPWKDIAAYVGTRTTRQTMTHAQKYRQKIERWKRGATIKPPSTTTPHSTTGTAHAILTPPASPVAPDEVDITADEAHEDAMFWQVLQDILEETDAKSAEAPLLYDFQPAEFTSTATPFDLEASQDYLSYDQVCEEFAALV